MGFKKGTIRKQLLYACYLTGITLLALEILLRFFYPFQKKIRGDKWQLSTNIVYRFGNDRNPKLDKTIINRRNSIGFRGPDPPKDINSRFSILTVGGSSTACTFLTEGKTWTDRLGANLQKTFPSVWINNAGLDGHSAYGHLNFMYYYLPTLSFKPKVMVFLMGANDVDRSDLSLIDSSDRHFYYRVRRWFENNSETFNFFRDLKWVIHPVDIFTDNQEWSFTNFKPVYLSPAYTDSALQKQAVILKGFRKRLYLLAELCRNNSIEPVFVTQPLVFGDGTPQGGNPDIDFHVFQERENGQLFWKKLSLFNQVTMQVAQEKQIKCIDLANLMPRDTSYYYDMLHYTNDGAEKVGDIIFDKLKEYLATQHHPFLKK